MLFASHACVPEPDIVLPPKKKKFWSDAMKLSQRKLQTYRRRYVVASSLPSWPHGEPFPEQHLMMVLINAVYGTAWCRNPIEADILH